MTAAVKGAIGISASITRADFGQVWADQGATYATVRLGDTTVTLADSQSARQLAAAFAQAADAIDQHSGVTSGAAAMLTSEDRNAMLAALSDAIFWCQDSDDCAECAAHPAGLCEPHDSRLDRMHVYVALQARLRGDQS